MPRENPPVGLPRKSSPPVLGTDPNPVALGELKKAPGADASPKTFGARVAPKPIVAPPRNPPSVLGPNLTGAGVVLGEPNRQLDAPEAGNEGGGLKLNKRLPGLGSAKFLVLNPPGFELLPMCP